MAITLSINGTLQATDSTTGVIALSKLISGLATTGTVFSEAQTVTAATGGGTTVSLPISPANFLYLHNLHQTNTIQVTWTPSGGASAIVLTLQPLAFIIFSQPAGSAGITALNLVGSASGTTAEYVIGG